MSMVRTVARATNEPPRRRDYAAVHERMPWDAATGPYRGMPAVDGGPWIGVQTARSLGSAQRTQAAMRLTTRLLPVLILPSVLSSRASAQSSTAAAQTTAASQGFQPSLVLDDGRTAWTPPDRETMRAQIHGEYQLRYQHQTDLPLTAPASDPSATTLGQTNTVWHWLRNTARFDFRDRLSIVGQIDVPYGFFLGETTRWVSAARDPRDVRHPMRVAPRWLYLEARTSYGLWRLGQQGSHWGMGVLANDGDHPSLFGDYRNGAIAERVLFATRPAGRGSALLLVLAGDLVYRDRQADLTDGDHAFQGIVAATLGSDRNQIGLYGVWRRQRREKETFDAFTPYTERLDAGILDACARFSAPVPGMSGYVFGEAEAAAIFGSTNAIRTEESAQRGDDERGRSYGGAARLGAVHVASSGSQRWGDWVLSIEYGYASGDADPNDGIQRRFDFDQNHKVGLILFDQVLGWSTARSATLSSDPALVARPSPGLQSYPSDGAIFGATYLYPTVLVRPKRWLDLKAAVVVAQTTADLADPYRYGVYGEFAGWRGGDPKRHDLGVETDLGIEARVDLSYGTTLQVGAQGGVLFPGHALDDDAGNAMPSQRTIVGRLGVQY